MTLGNDGLSIFGDTQTEDSLLASTGISGRTYYVNNITGDSGNSGLSWATAFDEVTTAITASNAYLATQATGNEYVRSAIFVQGTSTAYTALATLPNYCDVIGIGAPPNGNGSGIARIGANGADGIAGSARGLGLYNLQIISGGDFYCMDFVMLFRSTIQDCALMAAAHHTTGGMRFSSSAGGNKIVHNHWGSVAAHSNFITGLSAAGASFDHNEIEDNFICAKTYGTRILSTATSAGSTVFRRNTIGNLTGESCDYGVVDDAAWATGEYGVYHPIYDGNSVIASVAFVGVQRNQMVNNHTVEY